MENIYMAGEKKVMSNGFMLQPYMIAVGNEIVVTNIQLTHGGNHEMWGWIWEEGVWKRSSNIEQSLSSEAWDAVVKIADEADWFDEM